MSFPIDPFSVPNGERKKFHCQDSDIRSKIIPLFSFDPTNISKRPLGHGTAFRIDPWSRCITAYHNVEDLFDYTGKASPVEVRQDFRLTSLDTTVVGYGTLQSSWLPIVDGSVEFVSNNILPHSPRAQNLSEIAILRIRPARDSELGTPYLPLELRGWRPTVGEDVLAFGYAGLDAQKDGEEARPLSTALYGSFCKITDVEEADINRNRSWPMIRVDVEWEGGMSGGPVFNSNGNVIGIVSTGSVGMGCAACFFGWDIPRRLLGSIDPNNPGFFYCYGVLNAAEQLVYCGQDKDVAIRHAKSQENHSLKMVSYNFKTEDFILIASKEGSL